ncbi:MAG: hypothetical protein ACK4EZ_03045 [Fervidobacterium pennivorans]|uniref:Uncharacterized protein n=1 Tax=Fervidobacterium pennivorans TaxID=93466 RepID=A0A7V4FGP1_FERPE|nr:hypothetical protein [Fervidobacterium sp.]NPU90120.1 hypothetical protein [Fervidobacterium sp.]
MKKLRILLKIHNHVSIFGFGRILVFLFALIFSSLALSQTINIEWYYDEGTTFIIDEIYQRVSIGTIYIYSNVKFKFYVIPKVLDVQGVTVTGVRIKNQFISMNPSNPTIVTNKWVYGTMVIYFSYIEPPEDFKVEFTFVFLPL